MTTTANPSHRTSRGVAISVAALALLASGCGRTGDDVNVAGNSTEIITTTQPASQTVPTSAPPTTQLTYVVQNGDTLSVIAQRFGVATSALADFNAIADANSLKVGQQLNIPPTAAPATTASTATTIGGAVEDTSG